MLSEIMTAGAAAGGTAVVQAVGTDVWVWLRSRGARLIGRGDPARENDALDRLDRTAAALTAAADEADRERLLVLHQRLWQGEFASLLELLAPAERDRALAELHALEREFGGSGSSGGVVSRNTFEGPVAFQTGNHARQENRFGAAG
ncbi:hypothetical protein JHN63_15335 [Streptomyces sp. MBT65]|uniref:hypothetical protein n=1 Tax=Streptomyces sp. MBT65 TaxID=1488395 RepID=UPI00190BC5D7|nr:hypothetical protein [Streptomyces sp. MBT65]MBK3575160.1 hypothetical protein [Streptomyces sp. MBT65]